MQGGSGNSTSYQGKGPTGNVCHPPTLADRKPAAWPCTPSALTLFETFHTKRWEGKNQPLQKCVYHKFIYPFVPTLSGSLHRAQKQPPQPSAAREPGQQAQEPQSPQHWAGTGLPALPKPLPSGPSGLPSPAGSAPRSLEGHSQE